MKIKWCQICFLIVSGYLLHANYAFAHLADGDEQSFALEYKELRTLLQKVTSKETALNYKPAIEEQINYLKQTQQTGNHTFNAMSESQQYLFIKKFQNNRFHCGEVTEVMAERQRILLHPELSGILRDLLNQIP